MEERRLNQNKPGINFGETKNEEDNALQLQNKTFPRAAFAKLAESCFSLDKK